MKNKGINFFTQQTGYLFKDKSLFDIATTHTSFAYENDIEYDYERLEFLGDAVVELVISEELYRRFPEATEGQLTFLRSRIVRQKSLVEVAKEIGLPGLVLLGKGEQQTGGSSKKSLLADVMEAIIGAIYIDSGFLVVREFILKNFADIISLSYKTANDDFKTRLQEKLQKDYKSVSIEYNVLNSSGPDHKKEFQIGLYVNNEFVAKGIGRTKKQAEQEAASNYLAEINLKEQN